MCTYISGFSRFQLLSRWIDSNKVQNVSSIALNDVCISLLKISLVSADVSSWLIEFFCCLHTGQNQSDPSLRVIFVNKLYSGSVISKHTMHTQDSYVSQSSAKLSSCNLESQPLHSSTHFFPGNVYFLGGCKEGGLK